MIHYPFSAVIPTEPEVQYDPISKVIDAVCDYYGVKHEQVASTTRKRPIVTARQWCMYFLKEDGRYTLQTIADEFNRDHTSVIHSHRLISDLRGIDDVYMDTYRILKAIISK